MCGFKNWLCIRENCTEKDSENNLGGTSVNACNLKGQGLY